MGLLHEGLMPLELDEGLVTRRDGELKTGRGTATRPARERDLDRPDPIRKAWRAECPG